VFAVAAAGLVSEYGITDELTLPCTNWIQAKPGNGLLQLFHTCVSARDDPVAKIKKVSYGLDYEGT
jgi:hypothetical protein